MPKTIISKGLSIDGELSSDDAVTVEGELRGKLAAAKEIIIARSGRVDADVECAVVRVQGFLQGSVTSKTRIEVTPDAEVQADLRSPRVLIADGARFSGHVDMGGS